MRAHIISTKPPVGGRGRTRRTIVPGGILALSLAVVLLAATASTASAAKTITTWHCPPTTSLPTDIGQVAYEQVAYQCLGGISFGPTSFDFGDRQVGTASPVQRFALQVWCASGPAQCVGPETLNPTIAVPSDYAQTNNCPATLSAAYRGQVQTCIIEVTFAPTGTGPRAGTLSTGPGGPTVTLTGNGVTTTTPPVLPLLFDAGIQGTDPTAPSALLRKRLTLYAYTNYDSRVVAGGGVKRTVAETKVGGRYVWPPVWRWETRFKAKLKHLGRLKRRLKESPTRPTKVKIRLTATDEFGQRATDELKVKLCRQGAGGRFICKGDRSPRFTIPPPSEAGIAAVAKKTTEVKTSVQLKYHPNNPSDPVGEGGWFSGQVKARKGCQKGRKVVLYDHVLDLKHGSDESNARGKYRIKFIPEEAGPGLPGFYAEAKERTIKRHNGDRIVCKEGRSKPKLVARVDQ